MDCKSLSKIAIPDGVSEIGGGAFWGCGDMTQIYLPATTSVIGAGAFNACNRLKDIYYGGMSKNDWDKLVYTWESDKKGLNTADIHYNCQWANYQ